MENQERLGLWLGFAKFVLGTVVLGLVTTFVNHEIQSRQLEAQREKQAWELELAAEVQTGKLALEEQAHLATFIQHALAETIETRVRLAQFWAKVTTSPTLKAGWEEYRLLVEAERDAKLAEERMRAERSMALKRQLAAAEAKEEVDEVEKAALRLELSQSRKELESLRRELTAFELGPSAQRPELRFRPGEKLAGQDLSGRKLSQLDLRRADLRGANLQGTDLGGANLEGANLEGANLRGANLQRAELGESNLADANLSDANLSNATLVFADMFGTILSGADLSGADLGLSPGLRQQQLLDACANAASPPLLPDGFSPPPDCAGE